MYIGSLPAYQASGVRPRDEFTCDGTQICFALSQTVPGSFESSVTVVLDNVPQQPVEAFTVVDTKTLTFSAVTGTFTVNETVTGGTSTATGTVLKVNIGSIVIRQLTGTFTNTETVTGGTSSASATNSAVDTNSGGGILFSEAPAASAILYVVHEGNATYDLIPSAASVGPNQLTDNLKNFTVDTFTGNASTVAFTLSATPASANSILVMVDGVVQTRTTNYTLAGAVITFTGTPDTGAAITVIHLGFSTTSRTGLVDGSVTTSKIADGAVTTAKLATTLTVTHALGSASTPSITFTGDTNTGIFSPTADTIAFSEGGAEAARFDSSGNLGIGTASPATRLHTYVTANSATELARFEVSGDTTPSIAIYSNGAIRGKLRASTAETALLSQGALPLLLGTNDTERMRIDSVGQVGIGATPVTWGSSKALQIGLAGAFSGQTGAKTAEMTSNAYLNSGWKYLTSGDKASLYYQYDGAHTFNAAASTGSAGNAITWDAGTTINPYGVGIGGAISASGIGIKFPVAQNASSDPNTLDDYEEGTWTPDVRAGGSSSWTQKVGTYRKVGSLVNAHFVCDGNNSGTAGNLTLYGLPFALGSISGFVTFGIWSANGLSVPNGGFVQNTTGATSINIFSGGGQVSGQTSYISGMISYYTA